MPNEVLLLDTHCWLWAQLGLVQRLSRTALQAIRNAESEGNLRISVISIWELAMLEKRGRVALPMNIRSRVDQALSKPGIFVTPLNAEMPSKRSPSGRADGDPRIDAALVATGNRAMSSKRSVDSIFAPAPC